MTHNEPWVIAHHGYETADHAPLLKGQGYKAGHNLIRAHTKAYQLYVTKYKKTQKGKFKVLNSTFSFLEALLNICVDIKCRSFNKSFLHFYKKVILHFPKLQRIPVAQRDTLSYKIQSGITDTLGPEEMAHNEPYY